ncbi:PhnD/SsuA/transferrin family substrate-binding protein [Deinococcus cellulosilyticus]|uniref:Uncharacterized protein n=1 Tax=Deinococcus cellulosilyticus (strain DSM 18568 / NBRC 106333 / KACC 11606 / 5516J-15) TaxID=1223518 RepID=A0A511N1K6_DEIC1|nr:PhnD/SsuA/transferrin family substrate-binding protein [Deinococcus cellulosilyticus]GEM46754.1 hypothetical protein DC3_23890 [Deinococcus cellulosilyticus NBRC 106333 = KACC 11606]
MTLVRPITVDVVSLLGPGHQQHLLDLVRLFETHPQLNLKYQPAELWTTDEKSLRNGNAQAGFICGLLGLEHDHLDFLAVPVPLQERSKGQPVYFSDVIVHRDSIFDNLNDLAYAHWAFNDLTSLSGLAAPLSRLAQQSAPFGGRFTPSGSHLQSIQQVRAQQVDAAAIDSQVLSWVMQQQPRLRQELRIIESIGPFPAPPLAVHRNLDPRSRQVLQEALLKLHLTPAGQDLLHRSGFSHYQITHKDQYQILHKVASQASVLHHTGALHV